MNDWATICTKGDYTAIGVGPNISYAENTDENIHVRLSNIWAVGAITTELESDLSLKASFWVGVHDEKIVVTRSLYLDENGQAAAMRKGAIPWPEFLKCIEGERKRLMDRLIFLKEKGKLTPSQLPSFPHLDTLRPCYSVSASSGGIEIRTRDGRLRATVPSDRINKDLQDLGWDHASEMAAAPTMRAALQELADAVDNGTLHLLGPHFLRQRYALKVADASVPMPWHTFLKSCQDGLV